MKVAVGPPPQREQTHGFRTSSELLLKVDHRHQWASARSNSPLQLPLFTNGAFNGPAIGPCVHDGQAGYHGRVWQLHGFPPHLVARLRSKIDHVNRAPPACRHQAGSQSALHSRLSVMHWNPWPFTEQILRTEMVVATNTYRCVDSHRNSLGV